MNGGRYSWKIPRFGSIIQQYANNSSKQQLVFFISEHKPVIQIDTDEKPDATTSIVTSPTSSSSTLTAGLFSNVKPLLTQLTVDVTAAAAASTSPAPGSGRDVDDDVVLPNDPPFSSSSSTGIGVVGEKRRLDPDVSSSSTPPTAATATADTPPATLEPPEPKMRRNEGEKGDECVRESRP